MNSSFTFLHSETDYSHVILPAIDSVGPAKSPYTPQKKGVKRKSSNSATDDAVKQAAKTAFTTPKKCEKKVRTPTFKSPSCKATPSSKLKKPKKEKRTILGEHETASVGGRRTLLDLSEQDIVDHAHLKLQLLHLRHVAIFGRGYSTLPLTVEISVGHTNMQGRVAKLPFHAAHAAIIPSLVDDVIEKQKAALQAGEKLTPTKEKNFRAKECSEELLQRLKEKPNDTSLLEELDNLVKNQSLELGTSFIKRINLTNDMPSDFNKHSDGRFENSAGRRKALELAKRLIVANPADPANEGLVYTLDDEFATFAKNWFDASIPLIEERLEQLAAFGESVRFCLHKEELFYAAQSSAAPFAMSDEELVNYQQQILNMERKKALLEKEHSHVVAGHLRSNYEHFSNLMLATTSKPLSIMGHNNYYNAISTIWQERSKAEREACPKLLQEIEDRTNLFLNLKTWNQNQSKGYQAPSYEYLTGVFDEATKTVRRMNNSEIEDLAVTRLNRHQSHTSPNREAVGKENRPVSSNTKTAKITKDTKVRKITSFFNVKP